MPEVPRRAILEGGEASLTIDRSRFLGYALPIRSAADLEAGLGRVRALHPQATHWCFAGRIGPGQERQSDDGEPQGTAGLPLLETLRRRGIDFGLLCVVRYYGGRKLGRPGLYRAYLGAGAAALDGAQLGKVVPGALYELEAPHQERVPIERAVRDAGGAVVEEAFEERVRIAFWLPQEWTPDRLATRAPGAARARRVAEQTRDVPDEEGGGPA